MSIKAVKEYDNINIGKIPSINNHTCMVYPKSLIRYISHFLLNILNTLKALSGDMVVRRKINKSYLR